MMRLADKDILFDRLWKISDTTSLQGYAYVSEAPSMKNKFDYLIMFTPEFEIIKSKVLIYREQHGKQIGSQRWLKQFIGLIPQDKPILGGNIDGISGATISTTSMTKAIGEVLELITLAKKNNTLASEY